MSFSWQSGIALPDVQKPLWFMWTCWGLQLYARMAGDSNSNLPRAGTESEPVKDILYRRDSVQIGQGM